MRRLQHVGEHLQDLVRSALAARSKAVSLRRGVDHDFDLRRQRGDRLQHPMEVFQLVPQIHPRECQLVVTHDFDDVEARGRDLSSGHATETIEIERGGERVWG